METSTTNPKWSWWDISLVLAALLVMMPVSTVLRYALKQLFRTFALSETAQQSIRLFTGTALQAGIIISIVIFLAYRKGSTSRDLGLKWSNVRSNVATGLVGGIIVGITVIGLGMLVSLLFGPPPPQEVEKMLTGMKRGKDLLLPFIAVSILAPVSEELYFRGMVYPLLRSRLGVRTGLILSGLFFSALHLDFFRLVPIWVGGIVLAYYYEKTGSLITSMTAHSTWNTMMLFMMYLAARSGY